MKINVENKKGSYRYWWDRESKTEGKTKMLYDYGEIAQSVGMDGDPVDVFVGPDKNSKWVYVIHQMKLPNFKNYDEDKCMISFKNPFEAKRAYLKHFNNDKFFGAMSVMTMDKFKKKVMMQKKPEMLTAAV